METMPDIAIAHDAFTSDGGAERVAADLARLFDAPLYCSRVDDDAVPDDVEVVEMWDSRSASFWNSRSWWVPRTAYWIGRHLYRRQRATYAPELEDYDVIIQTKGPQWPYVPTAEQTLIRYVHSPPRRHYDLFHKTAGSFLSRSWSMMHRIMDGPSQRYPDRWVANSDVVARRIQLYYDIPDNDIDVVYPGVKFPGPSQGGDDGYYLYLGRLAGNKRIKLICEVAENTNYDIAIAGTGPEKDTVESYDHLPNLTYHGYVCESEKWKLLREARATLFFAEAEDFGIVPIESMAVGTPVIGVDEGFTRYQIQDGKNGYIANPHYLDAAGVIDRFEANGVEWGADDIRRYAEQFRLDNFNEQMQRVVETAREESRINPSIQKPVAVTQ